MKPRLILIVTALLIIPTAILSLLAARAVRLREESMERALANSADQTLRTVHGSLLAVLRRTHGRAVGALAAALPEYAGQSAPSQATIDLLRAESTARSSSSAVDGFYAVHLPGVLIYPPLARNVGPFKQPPSADFFRLDAANALQFAGNDTEGALQDFLDIAADPNSPDSIRASALLAAAQCHLTLDRPRSAVRVLQKISSGPAQVPAVSPETRDSEGSLCVLTALNRIVDICSVIPAPADEIVPDAEEAGLEWRKTADAARNDLLRMFVLLYDRVTPLQKGLLNNVLSTVDGKVTEDTDTLLPLLYERQRHERFAEDARSGLRKEIERTWRDDLPSGVSFLAVGADVYSFGPIVPDEQVFGGFRIDMSGLEEELAGIALRAAAGKDVVIRVLPEVSGMGSGSAAEPGTDDAPVASLRLPSPFEHILLLARPAQSGMGQGKDLRIRLQVWGVLVLALGILIGTWIVLRYAAGEVQRAKARGDLIAGVSHDLRTPLASMRMLADSLYLGRVTDPSRQKQFLSTIVRESSRLGTLVERILFFVRLGEEALTYQFRPTKVDAVVAEAIESFQGGSGSDSKACCRDLETGREAAAPPCSRRDASGNSGGSAAPPTVSGNEHDRSSASSMPDVKLDVEPDLPMVKADADALRQVVLNLVDNAVKYSKPMGDKIGSAREHSRVTIKVGRQGDAELTISVTDNGIGIPRNEMKKIFRRFYRVSGKQRDTVSGVGMGLALCRHIVAAHGGRIEVESEVGKGSTFKVVLPVRQ